MDFQYITADQSLIPTFGMLEYKVKIIGNGDLLPVFVYLQNDKSKKIDRIWKGANGWVIVMSKVEQRV